MDDRPRSLEVDFSRFFIFTGGCDVESSTDTENMPRLSIAFQRRVPHRPHDIAGGQPKHALTLAKDADLERP